MENKVKIAITVDTETFYINKKLLPFDVNIYGKVGNEELGIKKIIKACDDFQVKATFFVDVYEHYVFGMGLIRDCCLEIDQAGHSVQLHAHPNFIPGHDAGLMSSYDYHEQNNIIAEGVQIINDITGERPVAFRAGAYGADINTIEALKSNDFLIDSSYFHLNKNCILSQQLKNIYTNDYFMIQGILEIPISVYKITFPPFGYKVCKIDVNACSLIELKTALTRLISDASQVRDKIIIIFLHSFSFIKWNNSCTKAVPNMMVYNDFIRTVEFLKENYNEEIEFVKMDKILFNSFDKIYIKEPQTRIPSLKEKYLIPRLYKRIM